MTPTDLTCKEFVEFLDEYVEDQMTSKMRRRFDHHLDICRYCRDFLEEYRMSIDLARLLGDRAPESPIPDVVPRELIDAVRAAMLRDGDAPNA